MARLAAVVLAVASTWLGACDPCAGVVCDAPGACQDGPGACDGATGACVYAQRPEGTVCRPAAGACDAEETCSLFEPDCPEDAPAACVTLDCPEGFFLLPDGAGCDVRLPAATCPAGTMPVIGWTECQPVGWTSPCPDGFLSDPTGWGCAPVLPAGPCLGATRERLGRAECEPLGDCAGPWPPAAATFFVDPRHTDAQLAGGRRFRTLAAALAAAPAGATVAVEEGRYPETLTVRRAVSVVGRCAAKVRLEGTGARRAGIHVVGAGPVSFTGLTLAGQAPGLIAEGRSRVRLEHCLLEANREAGLASYDPETELELVASVVRGTLPDAAGNYGWGLVVEDGGLLTVEESAVTGNREKGLSAASGGRAVLRRSVVRGTTAGADAVGPAVNAQLAGTRVEVEESVLVESAGYGALALDGAEIRLVRSVVTQTRVTAGGFFGRGVEAGDGGRLILDECAVAENAEVAVSVYGEGSRATLKQSVLRDTRPNGRGDFGMGLSVQDGAVVEALGLASVRNLYYGATAVGSGARLTLQDSLVLETGLDRRDRQGRGLSVQEGAQLSATGTAVVGSHGHGVVFDGEEGAGKMTLTRCLVRDSQGLGVFGRQGGRLVMDQCALVSNADASVYTSDTTDPFGNRVEVRMSRTLVKDTRPHGDGTHGDAVVTGGRVHATECTLMGSRSEAVLVAGKGALVSLTRSVVRDTRVEELSGRYGHGVVALDGSEVRLVDTTVLASAGVGLLVQASSGVVDGGALVGNQTALQAQAGTVLREVEGVPSAVAPLDLAVSRRTVFLDNRSRVGAGIVPIREVVFEQ